MIKYWFLTGDTHGYVEERLTNINTNEYKPEETAIIILGDVGLNFYLNGTDKKHKINLQKSGFTFYCVRGNHEERPENIVSYHQVYDEEVKGNVWIQDAYPNIKFFLDGEEYNINGYDCLIIGGAYSVDKWHRLSHLCSDGWCGWFKDEQLSEEEMNIIDNKCQGKHYDFIFSHTCPIEWEPTDLFLSTINQEIVDKTMELWLDKLKDKISYHVWCFGHYHADQLIRPHVEMYFHSINHIDEVYDRWVQYDEIGEVDWWLRKSPHYYWE